ncbi:MAG: DUF6962 family protein [Methylobacter sp.]
MLFDNRLKSLAAIAVVAIIAAFSINPIAQAPEYHNFADQRSFFGIANFFNVLSNLPLFIIGIMGIRLVALHQNSGGLTELRSIYSAFFVGIFLTGFGSAYYHLHPNNQTLLWDRLPMTISFMALFSVVIGEYISVSLARKLFIPLLALGMASTVYWQLTEQAGRGDLRPYGLIQFLPIVLIPLILCWFKPRAHNKKYIWGLIGAYALAKLAEQFDPQFYQALGWTVSGHSLKHLFAALGTWIFYLGLRKSRNL